MELEFEIRTYRTISANTALEVIEALDMYIPGAVHSIRCGSGRCAGYIARPIASEIIELFELESSMEGE